MKYLLPHLSNVEQAINAMPYDKSFEVEDLFPPAVWNGIPEGDRVHIGREFAAEVKARTFPDVYREREAENEPLDADQCIEDIENENTNEFKKWPAKYVKKS